MKCICGYDETEEIRKGTLNEKSTKFNKIEGRFFLADEDEEEIRLFICPVCLTVQVVPWYR